jgi:hypothetical protein
MTKKLKIIECGHKNINQTNWMMLLDKIIKLNHYVSGYKVGKIFKLEEIKEK